MLTEFNKYYQGKQLVLDMRRKKRLKHYIYVKKKKGNDLKISSEELEKGCKYESKVKV